MIVQETPGASLEQRLAPVIANLEAVRDALRRGLVVITALSGAHFVPEHIALT
jgi:hypothetical protein